MFWKDPRIWYDCGSEGYINTRNTNDDINQRIHYQSNVTHNIHQENLPAENSPPTFTDLQRSVIENAVTENKNSLECKVGSPQNI